MPTPVTTETKELGDSRVRVEVEVASDALERELNTAARTLGRELKIPGFRKGKVPPEVVIRRVGRDAVLDEAVRRALPDWYEQAVHDAGIAAVGDPSLDLAELPEKGSPLQFSIEVAVRPEAELGEYKGLEAGRRESEVPAEEVDAEIERLRQSAASLENVDRAATADDFVVVDFTGSIDGEPFEGGEARGYLLELGSGRLVEGFEEQLQGASPGDEREVKVTFPEDYRAENLAGQDAVFAVSVKEVKEKKLPELDDDFAAEAGGFDTLEELRSDIEGKVRESREREIEVEFREAVVDAAAEAAKIDVTHDLIHAKAHEMWGSTRRRLERQGIPADRYLQIAGKTEEELVTEAEPDAERALRRESVLAAVIEAEGIEVGDDELLDSLREATAAGGGEAGDAELQKAIERAKAEGRDDALREDIAMRKAVDLLVESAKPIPLDQAAAREKIWTPDKEGEDATASAGESGKLWTPGS
ncbi:MAG: trigger factor [Thermoleophilaceae bacterium]|nr:trigger factor [Thermoleophilaceae bacterium]